MTLTKNMTFLKLEFWVCPNPVRLWPRWPLLTLNLWLWGSLLWWVRPSAFHMTAPPIPEEKRKTANILIIYHTKTALTLKHLYAHFKFCLEQGRMCFRGGCEAGGWERFGCKKKQKKKTGVRATEWESFLLRTSTLLSASRACASGTSPSFLGEHPRGHETPQPL